jgi:hypothetical protein
MATLQTRCTITAGEFHSSIDCSEWILIARYSNTLIVNFQSLSASGRCVHPVDIVLLPLNTSDNLAPRPKPKSSTTQHCPEQGTIRRHKSTLSNHEVQYLTLISHSVGKKGPICAIFRANCQRNFISNRIIKRFNLTSYVDFSANTSTVVAGESRITPSRNYVALVTPTAVGNQQNPHRFYVVEHCLEKFDVLIGSDIITNLSSSSK